MHRMQVVLSILLIISSAYAVANVDEFCDPIPGTPVNVPLGHSVGVVPGRVVWHHRPDATTWNGDDSNENYWWKDENVGFDIVKQMLDETLMSVADCSSSVSDAWNALFEDFNERHTGKRVGYTKGEKIACKLNLNMDILTYEFINNGNGPSPQFLKALVEQLVEQAKVPAEDLYFYDGSRLFDPRFTNEPEGIWPQYEDVHIVDNMGSGYGRERIEPDFSEDNVMFFSHPEVPSNNDTRLPTILTGAKYFIELNGFRGHQLAGITASGKNFFGSIYRPDVNCQDTYGRTDSPRQWCPRSLHQWINVTTPGSVPMGAYNPLVDLMGHPHTDGKAVLILADGLYGGVRQGNGSFGIGIPPCRFESKPFNNHWSSSIFASQDPIAMDSVIFDFLRNEPNVPWARRGCVDNYLHEAAEADNPPSGTVYNPSGKPGQRLKSLGTHEHWNNAKDKQYSKNLNSHAGKGIELVQLGGDFPIGGDSSSDDGVLGFIRRFWFFVIIAVVGVVLIVCLLVIVFVVTVVGVFLHVWLIRSCLKRRGMKNMRKIGDDNILYSPVNPGGTDDAVGEPESFNSVFSFESAW